MIHISNISKRFKTGTLANDQISMHIAKGEILGIIGPNGAGKTTFVRQLVGLSKPTEGEIKIADLPANARREDTAQLISFFNQKTALLDAHTVYEVIFFAGVYRGLSKVEAHQETEWLLKYFHLNQDQKKRMRYLSGGQKKIVMLAAAFVGKMPIIVLDEPTNDLDPINRSRLWQLIKQYNEEGTTFIVVSHNISELESVVRKVAIMKGAKIADYGDIQHLKAKYNQGYRISIRSEYDLLKTIIKELNRDYRIEEQNNIIIEVGEDELSETMQDMMELVKKHRIELKLYQNTLSDVYQITQKGASHV